MPWGGKRACRRKGGGHLNTKHPAAVPSQNWINYPVRALHFARRGARLLTALFLFSAGAVTLAQQAIKTGPEVGSTLPAFEAPDQNGRVQNLQSILGPKGALLVFYRSADW